MRKYQYFDINELGLPSWYVDGKPHPRFGYELKLVATTNATLMANFQKIAKWVSENCPHLNGKFKCKHDPYRWIELVVENGKAYLEYGSHGNGFDVAVSTTETAVFSRGSCQEVAYAFKDVFFAHNNVLEKFISEWPNIKARVVESNAIQTIVYSDDFVA